VSYEELTWEEFETVDMRVGRITKVEEFPEARRPAYKLEIDFGAEIGTRRSSAQIANYERSQLEGRLVVGVVNFPSKQIGPVRSEVLVLGAVSADGVVRLLAPDEGAELGERIA
jgi:tRNA-binding protein